MPADSPDNTADKPAAASPADVAKPSRRRIFSYEHDGATSSVDPMRIDRRLYEALAGEDVASLFAAAYPGPPPEGMEADPAAADAIWFSVTEPARRKFADAARAAFGFPELQPDGSGMTDLEAFELFDAFDQWKAGIKKNTDSPPSDTPLTAGSTGDDSATPPSAG